jgi:hypothetical protein
MKNLFKLILEVQSENVRLPKLVSMIGSYYSKPLTGSYVTQTWFLVRSSDFMITDWGNSIADVMVKLCFPDRFNCWGIGHGLTPASPNFTESLSATGFMDVQMFTWSSKQGIVGYQIF